MTLSEIMSENQLYYETMYILRPDIPEDEVSSYIEKYNKLLEKAGGNILDSQMRGKRRLAYTIAKHREGIYVQLSHQGDGQHVSKFEKNLRLSEDVIRYMTVKQDGPLPTPKPSNKTQQTNDSKNTEKTDNDKAVDLTKEDVNQESSESKNKDQNEQKETTINEKE